MSENNEIVEENSTPLLSQESNEDVIIHISEQQYHSKLFKREIISKVMVEITELYKISIPMILAGLLVYGKSAISMYFMGMMGKSAQAGGSLAIGIANISAYSILAGLATGMEGICSQAFGAGQWRLIGQTLNRTILILLLASIVMLVLWLNSGKFFFYWCQNPTVAAAATTYLTVSTPSLIFQCFINPLKIYLRTQNITTPLIYSAIIVLGANYTINYYLVYHWKLGIRAIALATVFSDLSILIFLSGYIYLYDVYKRTWPGWSFQCFTELKPILYQSIPSCISICLEWWWYEIMIVLSGFLHNADEAIACMGILIQATSLVYQFPFSLNQAVSTRVGNKLGANEPNNAKMSSLVALCCGALTGVGMMLLMVRMKNLWGGFFTTDKEVQALVVVVLPIVGLCELGNCPQTTACGALRGSARPTLAAFINLGTFYVIGLPVALLACFKLGMGLVGLWYGHFVAQVVCLIVMIVVLVKTDWAKQAERAKELTSGANADA